MGILNKSFAYTHSTQSTVGRLRRKMKKWAKLAQARAANVTTIVQAKRRKA